MQESLPDRSTLIPIICASDVTHLTNFSGDQKAWPVYLTIGNLPSDIRNAPSNHQSILLALLPIGPKRSSLKLNQKAEVESVIQQVLYDILQPLDDVYEQGIELTCGDGYVRQCFPRLSAWCADHMEYVNLLGLFTTSCPRCEVPPNSLGNGTLVWPERDYSAYRDQLDDTEDGFMNSAMRQLNQIGVNYRRIAFSSLHSVSVESLHKPDLLHGIYKGIVEHTLSWLVKFMKKHKRFDRFNKTWSSLPAYPGFSPFKKHYDQITSWQGKELRMAVRILCATTAVALSEPNHTEREPFTQVQRALFALVNFILLAQYRHHDALSIGYMNGYWQDWHADKDIFLEFRPTKKARKQSNAIATKARIEANELLAKGVYGTGAHGRATFKRELDRIEEECHKNFAALCGFNFVKFHLPLHYDDHVRNYGNLQGFSTDAPETSHIWQLKRGYNASNHVNAHPQMLKFYNRHHQFKMRELNLRALVKEDDDRVKIGKVFTSLLNKEGNSLYQFAFHLHAHMGKMLILLSPLQIANCNERLID